MDKKQILTVLGPALGVGLIVVLIGAVAAISSSPVTPTGPAPLPPGVTPPPEVASTTVRSDLSKMSDGTDPTAEDPNLKDGEQGLKYRDLKEGTGDPVPAGARVKVHYTGWLTTGKIFDSSVRNGSPAEFGLNGVVKGWSLGIPGMKPGGVRKLVIPPDLGYGSRGAPGAVPPNATMVFEVELLQIQ